MVLYLKVASDFLLEMPLYIDTCVKMRDVGKISWDALFIFEFPQHGHGTLCPSTFQSNIFSHLFKPVILFSFLLQQKFYLSHLFIEFVRTLNSNFPPDIVCFLVPRAHRFLSLLVPQLPFPLWLHNQKHFPTSSWTFDFMSQAMSYNSQHPSWSSSSWLPGVFSIFCV